jgi:hypothetical protein
LRPIITKILRDLVLIFGLFFIVWGLAQVQYGKVEHGVGTTSVPIDTQMASPGSMISVTVDSGNITTETRVIKLESRDAFMSNGTLVDKYLVAGGADGGGKGTKVNLFSHSPSLSATGYRIMVLDGSGTTDTINSVHYTVNYTLWMPDYTLILIGFLMIFMSLLFMAISKIRTREVPVDVGEEPEPAPPMRAPPARMPGPMAPPSRAQPGYGRQPPARAPPSRAPPPVYEEPPAPEEEYYPPEEAPEEPYQEPEVIQPPPPPARAPPAAQKPVAKIRCSACGEIIPIFTKNRPIRVTCSNCGRSGTLR